MCWSLKSWGDKCEAKTLHSLGRCWELGGSVSIVWHWASGRVYGKSIFQPFLLLSTWVFSHSSDEEE